MSLEGTVEGKTLVGSINKCDVLTISAYGIAVKNGFEGTEEEWLESLKGDFDPSELNGKFAPAGYGLGTTATYPPNDNLNEALANGWYWTGPNPGQHPETPGMEYAVAFTKNRSAGRIVQELTGLDTNTGCQMNRFTLDGGSTWVDEWVNPPMFPGVEYRTTERHNGKAVYKKLDADGNVLWRPEGEEEWRSAGGKDGFSPMVSIGVKNWGHTVQIVDAEGANTFDVKDGYTPVAGVDYYTEAEKAEMVNAVLAALPNGDEVSY